MIKQRYLLMLTAALPLCACLSLGNSDRPIATMLVPALAPAAERIAIVVLPGSGHNAETLKDRQVDRAIHQAWPQADVFLTSATLAYYKDKVLAQRLEQDVLAAVRQQGYEQVWLVGVSVGGLGAVLYEFEHPGAVTGLVLIAPWLGSEEIIGEIRRAGGVRSWDPGPVPEEENDDNYEREKWREMKQWSQNSVSSTRIWLLCGKDDPLIETSQLVAALIPESQYLEVSGAHDWETWLRSAKLMIAEIRAFSEQPGQRASGLSSTLAP